MKIDNRFWSLVGVSVLLIAITWSVYAQTLGNDYVNYDDDVYVYANPSVLRGLTFSGIGRAFSHLENDSWHPLTMISHMLDCQLFGSKPAGHHFTNVLLHSLAAVLLFLALCEMTAALWPSAFVAAVFAIHPLHVESVAWISERKDVLSALFFALTVGAYARYARAPSIGRYIVMSIFFVLGLMSKPMFVTVPLVLFLIDYWPLNRTQKSEVGSQKRTSIGWLIVEKIPLFVLSAVVSVVTLFVQKEAMPRLGLLPFGWRIANALTAYLIYVRQMFWPANLALGYPHPGKLPLWQIAGASALLIAITIAGIALRKRKPYFVVGWCWYVIMLLPVIGLAQVGGQAHADRYTYLPQIGLYVAATWAIGDLAKVFRVRSEILTTVATMIVAAFVWRTAIQVRYWRDSETLWHHTLAVTSEKNDVAHFYLGEFLLDQHRVDESLAQFRTVASRHPDDAETHYDLGLALLQKNQTDEAMAEYQSALRIDPNHSDAETELANLLLDLGRGDEAIGHFRNVVWLHPTSAAAHYNLGRGLYRLNHVSEAIVHYEEAVAIEPDYPDAASSLTQALLDSKQTDERFRSKKP